LQSRAAALRSAFVGNGDFVGLGCRTDALEALSRRLTGFGAGGGAPDWLVSGVWLRTPATQYLATSSTHVLSDGYVARALDITPVREFVEQLKTDLPDVSERLAARCSDIELPSADEQPAAPRLLSDWPGGDYETFVVLRRAARSANVHRIGCALLFTAGGGRRLLIGADPSTPAMVVSEDEALIERYCDACELIPAAEYVRRFGC
jgi:hypothetical protein